jgi:hypothetical protein
MKYFNVTKEEINKKIFNIFIGISLGNKLLTPELAKKYVKWAYNNTKDDTLILIADKIDIINWQIFRGLNKKEAEEKVQQKAYNVAGMFEKAKRILYKEENNPDYITKVHTIFWSDIENKGYKHLKEILINEYKKIKNLENRFYFLLINILN